MKIPGINRKSILYILLGLLIGALSLTLLTVPVLADDASVSVGVSPATSVVSSGTSFTVDLVINTATPIRGWQADINFDASKLQCTGVTEGGFLRDFAQANGGSTFWVAPKIDNTSGTISTAMCVITGARTTDYAFLGAAGSGTLCTLAFTAKPQAAGVVNIAPVHVELGDTNYIANFVSPIVVNSGAVGIGDTSTPLVVPPPITEVFPQSTPVAPPPLTATTPIQIPRTPIVIAPPPSVPTPAWVPVSNLPPVTPPTAGDVFTKVVTGFSVDPADPNSNTITILSGSIIRHRSDGITEVFDSQGNLILRALDDEAATLPTPGGTTMQATYGLQLPNNAFIVSKGNVDEVYLENVLIATVIYGDVPNTTPTTTPGPVPTLNAPVPIPTSSQQTPSLPTGLNLNPIPLIGTFLIIQTGYSTLPTFLQKRHASAKKDSTPESKSHS